MKVNDKSVEKEDEDEQNKLIKEEDTLRED